MVKKDPAEAPDNFFNSFLYYTLSKVEKIV